MRKFLISLAVVACLTLAACTLLTKPADVIDPVTGQVISTPDPTGQAILAAYQANAAASPYLPYGIGGVIGLILSGIQVVRQRKQLVKSTDLNGVLVEMIQTARQDPKFAAKFGSIVEKVLAGSDIPLSDYTALIDAIKEKYGIPSVAAAQ